VTSNPTSEGAPSPRSARRVAAANCALQALVLVALAVLYVVELGRGETADTIRVVMSIVLILLFAAALVALARSWLAGVDWPRTPTIVWNVLLLPVAWGLHGGGQDVIAVLVALSAIAGLAAALGGGDGSREDADTRTGSN
jgi:hypothetical protein